MNILKYFISAVSSLLKNKLRTTLSTLGIVIGISSVTIMLALGEGLKAQMLENLSVSNDVISIVENNSFPGEGEPTETPYIKVNDIFNVLTIDSIQKYVGNIKGVAGLASSYGGTSKFDGKDLYSQITGITKDYLKLKKINILYGYGFTNNHYNYKSRVVILGNDLVKYDLEGKNPIGKNIMIGGYSYDIIGVLDKSTDWQLNYSMIVPITTLESSFGVKKLTNMYIFVNDILKIDTTKKDILFLLMKLSGLDIPSDAKFRLESNDEAIKEINKMIMQMQLFLGGIAGISLLVGGIGIMNIMLVSVIERTREIGIRKAIGAKKSDIIIQFLTEAIVISILGCIIAFAISLLGVYLVNKYSPMPAKFSLNVIIFSSLVSMAMGIIFGLFPAWKAAKMKPIDALRFE
ncbi:MAG: ABC transporter permease [Candidatus Gracilibacteria bacterium]|nr:ABC transporter permease [Candidatus Gracilibacteria bacterium]